IGVFTVEAHPSLRIMPGQKSPPHQVVDDIQRNLCPEKALIDYDRPVGTWVRFYLKRHQTLSVAVERLPDAIAPDPGLDAYGFSGYYPGMGSLRVVKLHQQSPALILLGFKYLGPLYNVWLSKAHIVYFDFIPRSERISQWMRERGYCLMRNNNGSDKILSLK